MPEVQHGLTVVSFSKIGSSYLMKYFCCSQVVTLLFIMVSFQRGNNCQFLEIMGRLHTLIGQFPKDIVLTKLLLPTAKGSHALVPFCHHHFLLEGVPFLLLHNLPPLSLFFHVGTNTIYFKFEESGSNLSDGGTVFLFCQHIFEDMQIRVLVCQFS